MTRVSRKHRSRALIIIIVLIVLATVAVLYILNTTKRIPNESPVSLKVPVVNKTSTDTTYGLPVRLQIPKIHVDTNISYMGLTKDGDMDVPPDLINVGWYKYGTKPGSIGSAVIAGHLEGTKDLGVFINLETLRAGDIVNVRNDRDETISFVVRKTLSYKQDERPTEIFHKTDGVYLNLITCSGIWSNSQKRYSHRLVVFTEKVI